MFVEMFLEGSVGQDFGGAELGGDHFGVDLVAMLAGDVPAHGVVSGEGAVAEGTRNPDALVTLADVRPEVRFVTIGSLAEWTFQLRA